MRHDRRRCYRGRVAIAATLEVRDVRGARRRLVTGLFAANLALNLAWRWIFFRGRALAPYSAWVTFATALTWTIAVRD